ncbi:lysyl-tRNA synthetase [Dothidotthia symphoricarpi CBS 119687]|uniref:Lysyl-tRNA synthetase n=1 Tax=Dothidotthia symphoricarpi CBS 119687 TaxID=1392245 RepID=A0A6A6A8L2_9PLEO|nr:lysyl-tRNA synthetase [Dothidotthia symphoricarpi CBS 119687]KAF2128180.1 lysyl-tRNA synthetase [Dothidotthia symphoricarpi CBS 119687]
MSRNAFSFLRPYQLRGSRSLKPEHARAYLSVQRRSIQTLAADEYTGPHDVEKQKRIDQLRKVKPLGDYHPRMVYPTGADSLSLRDFHAKYEGIQETKPDLVSVFGRVRSVRSLGSKLMFLDIERDTQRLQVMVELKKLSAQDGLDEGFKDFKKMIRIGDWVSITGNPTSTSTGQLSVLAQQVPHVLAPCLHHVPEKVDNAETLARRPHIHQLTSNEPGDVLRLRALIYDYVRTYFIQSGFLEVETPIFDVNAGGAIARPFETVANELSNMSVRLRIAPELNLKRLIVGGQDKIFEIGRVFRNEGVDNTHNPEFSTCEFYEVGATLPALIERTEQLVHGLHTAVESLRSTYFPSLAAASEDVDFSQPFAQLPFISTIEKASGRQLPDLSSANASTELLGMFDTLGLAVPPNPTLPRLLDTLAEHYIEPLCKNPTFITQHPEALSPLSKSYLDEATGQRVASRVELFINGREYVNAYEEENSPFEQRRKFMQQQQFHPEGEGAIDESYLEVLEWGMPPTGGWGCGLDRLVMLFANKKRIADVLPFGTLRNVVSIAKTI